jgi:hypothetical protein
MIGGKSRFHAVPTGISAASGAVQRTRGEGARAAISRVPRIRSSLINRKHEGLRLVQPPGHSLLHVGRSSTTLPSSFVRGLSTIFTLATRLASFFARSVRFRSTEPVAHLPFHLKAPSTVGAIKPRMAVSPPPTLVVPEAVLNLYLSPHDIRLTAVGTVLSTLSNSIKWRCANQHSARNQKWLDSGRGFASLRLDCFLISFRTQFLCHSLLQFFSVHSVAFGGIHENVVAACGGSLISRIQ